MKRVLPVLVLVVCTLVLSSGASSVQAQEDNRLGFNVPVIVTLNAGVNVVKTFTVLEEDRFELRLSRLAEFTYSAVLIDPTQAVTPLIPLPDGSASLLVERVQVGGTYQLVLQATNNSGDLVIQLISSAVEPLPISVGEFTANLAAQPLRYRLAPPPGSGLMLLNLDARSMLGPAARLPGLIVADAVSGQTVLTLAPAMLPRLTLWLAGDAAYILALEPGNVPQTVFISWQADAGAGPVAISTAIPSPTPVSGSGPILNASGPCQILLTGSVNVRSGPGLEYEPPLGQAAAGTLLLVTGQNGSYSWYQVNYNTTLGWVSGQIEAVQLQGDCTAVPAASYPPPPVNAIVPGAPTATATAIPPGVPTATSPGLPTAPPPAPPTATYTYTPPPPVAPPDSNYAMNVPLDGTTTLSDYVSFPNGDVEDFVGYSVTGLNANVSFSGGQADLSIQLLCQGTGSEYIVFRVDGTNYTCGQTFTRRVNFDSNTGGVRITATGGSATYVQWTLQAQAPRVQ